MLNLRKNLPVIFIASILLVLIACGGAGKTTTPAPPTSNPISVTMNTHPQDVVAGGSLTVTASIANDDANMGLAWSVSCSTTGCGSLSASTGTSVNYSAPTSVTSDITVTITATSKADATKSASLNVTVTAPPAISVAISPSTAQSVSAAGPLNFTATVSNDSGNMGVTWVVSCSQADCGSLSSTSASSITYTAPAAVAANLGVTLTATSVADNTKSASVAITVAPLPVISVSINPSTPQSIAAAGVMNFSAAVTNDLGNKGVTWAVSCSQPDCGSLSGSTSSATTYNAPATVAADLAVTLTATSVADATKSASVAITVTAPAPAALLKGQYGFVFNGFTDATINGPMSRYSMIGSIIADGNGNITAGSAIVNSIYGEEQTAVTGTYTVGADHRGTMSLSFADHSALVSANPYIFAFALANITNGVAGKVAFIEGDDASGMAQRGNGVLLLQNPAAFQQSTITGGYAFVMIGESAAQAPLGAGGVLTSNGSGGITAGTADFMTYAGAVSNGVSVIGTYSTTDATYGFVPLQLTIGSATATTPSNFTAVIIDAHQLLLMSTDAHASKDIYAGWARQQAQASFGDASLNGNFVASGLAVQDVSSAMQFESDLLQGSFDGAGSMTVNISDSDVGGTYAGNQSVGTATLNIGTNGRVTVAGTGIALYLYDQNKGYYVNWHDGSGVGYGEFAPQDTSVTTLADLATPFIFYGEWSLDNTHPDFSGVVSIDPAGPVSFTDDYAYQGPLQTMVAPYTATVIGANGRFTMLDQWNDTAQICYATSAKKVDCLNPTAVQPSVSHIEK